jgi:hypothetical protein
MTSTCTASIIALMLLAEAAAPSALHAQSRTAARRAKTRTDSAYLAQLRVVQSSGDTSLSLTPVRRAFAATSFYAPYESEDDDKRKDRMWTLLRTGNQAGARAIADSLLSKNFLDLDAHVGAGAAAAGVGDSTMAATHFAFARSIVRSILSTGDGRTPEHPLFVLSPSEEYSFLNVTGLRRAGSQALSKCGGRACDVLEVAPLDGGATFALYFDVSLATEWMKRQLSGSARTP